MNKVRLSRSIVGQREADAVVRVILEDGYLGMGSEVQWFESDLASFLNIPSHTVACVNSGTAALHLAVQSIAEPGDEVLVQSLTYVATFQAIAAAGVKPVACEVSPETLTIDLNDAARRLTSRTKAIMPVHYASNPGDLEAVYRFAKDNNLRVIEDAAHAFGCTYKGKKIGSFGDIICFSFDGIKNITSGEGGMLATADTTVLSRVKDARLLGVEKDTEKRYVGQRSWEFDVTRQGYRFHMSNIFAAIGRTQLQRFEAEFATKRVALAKHYCEKLKDVTEISLLPIQYGPIVPHLFPILIKNGQRDLLRKQLELESIETGIHYKPNHLLSYFGGGTSSLPVTEKIYGELISLPLHPGLEAADVDHICENIIRFLTEEKK